MFTSCYPKKIPANLSDLPKIMTNVLAHPERASAFVIELQDMIPSTVLHSPNTISDFKESCLLQLVTQVFMREQKNKKQYKLWQLSLIKNIFDFVIAMKLQNKADKKSNHIVFKEIIFRLLERHHESFTLKQASDLFSFSQKINHLNVHTNPGLDWVFRINNTSSWQIVMDEIRIKALERLWDDLEKISAKEVKIAFLKKAREMAIFKDHRKNKFFVKTFCRTDAVLKINAEINSLSAIRSTDVEIDKWSLTGSAVGLLLESKTDNVILVTNYRFQAGRFITSLSGIPFYQSSGDNSGEKGTWFPFCGLTRICNSHVDQVWYIKPAGIFKYKSNTKLKDINIEKLKARFPKLLAAYLQYLISVSTHNNVRGLVERLANFEAMCFSMCIGGGFWNSETGKELEEFIRAHYESDIKGIMNAQGNNINNLNNVKASQCKNIILKENEQFSDNAINEINAWLQSQPDSRISSSNNGPKVFPPGARPPYCVVDFKTSKIKKSTPTIALTPLDSKLS